MVKVLVTGANGQLGRSIQDLRDKDQNIKFTFTSSEELDITNKNTVTAFFTNGNYDFCINCAAYTAVDMAETEKRKAHLINAEATKYLAEACNENGTVLIHISTDFVFDGQKRTPYEEDDETNPIGVYGASKLKGEKYIQQILNEYFIIRTSWVYSEYGNNFVKTMLRLANERDEINVVSDQVGSPTYAGDLAKFLFDLVQKDNDRYGIYHYSNKGVISWYDFAIEIFKLANKTIKVNDISSSDYPTLAKRPSYSVMKSNKFHGTDRIDWKISLKYCLKRML